MHNRILIILFLLHHYGQSCTVTLSVVVRDSQWYEPISTSFMMYGHGGIEIPLLDLNEW